MSQYTNEGVMNESVMLQSDQEEERSLRPVVNPQDWMILGIPYIMLAVLVRAPVFLPQINQTYLSSLWVAFLMGVSYLARDALQLFYEQNHQDDVSTKVVHWWGFVVSLVFVMLGFCLVWATEAEPYRVPGAVAFLLASLVGGLVFSALAQAHLGERLFYSSFAAACTDQLVYYGIRSLDAVQPAPALSISQYVFYVFAMLTPAWLFLALRAAKMVFLDWLLGVLKEVLRERSREREAELLTMLKERDQP